MSANATHIVIYGRSTRRLTLTQPPGYRTGADIAPAGPTPAERMAVAALQCSGFTRLEQTIRAGTTKATVSTPKPAKVQAKKSSGCISTTPELFNHLKDTLCP